MSDSADVILFPKAPDGTKLPPASVRPGAPSFTMDGGCTKTGHRKLELDKEAHQLVCGACGQVLDPFDWIVRYVEKWDRENLGYRQAKQQRKNAEAELARLQRAITNAKARARRPGVNISAGQARTLLGQVEALGRVLMFKADYDQDEWVRLLDRAGVKRDALVPVTTEIRRQLDLRDPPAEAKPA